MSIALVLGELHEHEHDLARRLHACERHSHDPEFLRQARELVGLSRRHLAEIAAAGDRFHLGLDPDPDLDTGLTEWLHDHAADLAGYHPDPALPLLRDLRDIHVQAAEVSMDWVMIAAAADTGRDTALHTLARSCHPDTLRQLSWAQTQIEQAAPTILLS